MRLINTTTLAISEFWEPSIPKYVILSHTWQTDEVSLQEFVSNTINPTHATTNKLGFQKVIRFCNLCTNLGHEWAWIDTCCIDKTNSAELSEAINSMFRWYRLASMCIVYLFDMPATPSMGSWTIQDYNNFQNSVWFTRGWTLQELLAPKEASFYDQTWSQIGTKESLKHPIATATGIDVYYVQSAKNIGLACAAEKLSWISKRRTTREEDMAYCLLGLFQVHMPLLYGEGNRAFIRLQEEILKISADHSLFAWFVTPESFPASGTVFQDSSSSLLAPSPTFFAASRDVRRRLPKSARDHVFLKEGSKRPYQMTNRGLQIELPLVGGRSGCEERHQNRCRLGVLNCYLKSRPEESIALHIAPQAYNLYSDGELWLISDGEYERTHIDQIKTVDHATLMSCTTETLFVRRGIPTNLSVK